MSRVGEIGNTDRISGLNIALMLGSAAVALYVPFELFLFSYAVLGPLHYLTEISWLHERNYFTKGRRDCWILGALVLLALMTQLFPASKDTLAGSVSAMAIFTAFFGSLVLVVTSKERTRFIALIVVALLTVSAPWMRLFLMVFLPTLVHVYVFTGLFMLYGALKGHSRSGYLACAIFALCPLIFIFYIPQQRLPSQYAGHVYPLFQQVNLEVLSAFHRDMIWNATPVQRMKAVFFSPLGLVVMRFIAFAYTYHYLNWFSKTSIIQWHRISKARLAILLALWLASVVLFLYDYSLGFTVLFGLGLLHVVLEFPLNHTSILGIIKELRQRLREHREKPATALGFTPIQNPPAAVPDA